MVELALHLDPGADTPLYEQLYGALAGQIRTGRLARGHPPARQAQPGGQPWAWR